MSSTTTISRQNLLRQMTYNCPRTISYLILSLSGFNVKESNSTIFHDMCYEILWQFLWAVEDHRPSINKNAQHITKHRPSAKENGSFLAGLFCASRAASGFVPAAFICFSYSYTLHYSKCIRCQQAIYPALRHSQSVLTLNCIPNI